mgnify:CR=1 FL=1
MDTGRMAEQPVLLATQNLEYQPLLQQCCQAENQTKKSQNETFLTTYFYQNSAVLPVLLPNAGGDVVGGGVVGGGVVGDVGGRVACIQGLDQT